MEIWLDSLHKQLTYVNLLRKLNTNIWYNGFFPRHTWYNESKSNDSQAEHSNTHPLCFMCGGLSMRTANLIFKSESWLFLGTIIRCSSAALELLEVGYSITCKQQKRTAQSAWYRIGTKTFCKRFPMPKEGVNIQVCLIDHWTHPSQWMDFSILIHLFFTSICFPYYHTMSFLSLHNELMAQYVAFELPLGKYLMDTYNFNTISNNSEHRSSGKKTEIAEANTIKQNQF